MQTLVIISDVVFRHRDDVDRVARAVDHGSRSNTDFWRYLAAASIVSGCLPGLWSAHFPQIFALRARGIGIKRVDRSVFRDDIQNISNADVWNCQAGRK